MPRVFKNRSQSSAEKTDELLSAYLDGMLALDERAAIEERLRQEPALYARLTSLRNTKKALAGLPTVEVPRNFILSPSMVSVRESVTPPRRRTTWSMFGWATAAAALLFIVAFAGDVFVVSPSVGVVQPAERDLEYQAEVRVEREVVAETEVAQAAAAPAVEQGETAAVESETVVEKEIVVEETLAVEASPPPMAEGEVVPTAAAGGGIREVPATETSEMLLQAAAPVSEELPVEEAPATAPDMEASLPTVGASAAAKADLGGMITPSPAASPQAEPEEPESLAEALPTLEATAEAVAIAPLEVRTSEADTAEDAERILGWLRWTEIGLGVIVIGLAIATVILRRRGV